MYNKLLMAMVHKLTEFTGSGVVHYVIPFHVPDHINLLRTIFHLFHEILKLEIILTMGRRRSMYHISLRMLLMHFRRYFPRLNYAFIQVFGRSELRESFFIVSGQPAGLRI